jgi:sucrose-6-phosphate hydrolase SacC (GH32 family)
MKSTRGEQEVDRGRRLLLAASSGLLLPRLAWTQVREGAVLCWRLDGHEDTALESVSHRQDAIASRAGHALWVGEGRDRALRLDGYSTWVDHAPPLPTVRWEALTAMVWVAFESYPVEEAALLEVNSGTGPAWRFSVDRLGFLHCGPLGGDSGSVCRSAQPVTASQWVHLAVSIGASGVTLYQDGSPVGHLQGTGTGLVPGSDAHICLGKSSDCRVVARVFPTGVLNGLMRDMRVYDKERTRSEIALRMAESKPESAANLQINGPWCVADPQRPIAHAQPPRAWTNEPHGLIRRGGKYHLFYQKNPNGPYWGHIHWGHLTSPDLARWTEQPVALAPQPGVDSEGCWSGSVVDQDGRLAVLYTGGNGHESSICLAHSDDGVHFTKYGGNPVIEQPPPGHGFAEFRDPFVWREGEIYYAIIGSAVSGVGGAALLYRSLDLVSWEYRKPLLTGDRATSGTFWEMPIFVKAGDYHVLIVCEVPGRSSYWVGIWQDENFTPISTGPRRLELFNHLLSPTPMLAPDGRLITMGIIPDERSPRETWAAGWAHLYSLPRVLTADPDGFVRQHPLDVLTPWMKPLIALAKLELNEGAVQGLAGVREKSLHLRATFRRGASASVSLFVRRSPGGEEQTEICYEWASGLLIFDRTLSSLDPRVRRNRQETVYAPLHEGSLHLEVFVDRSVLEVFVDGRAAFAARIYPTLSGSDGAGFACTGGAAAVEKVSVARILRPA